MLSAQIINRLGLILDFFAGFLLAPEIVGKNRLRQLEMNVESSLQRITEDIGEVEEILRDWRNSRYKIPIPRRFPYIGKILNRRFDKKQYPTSNFHIFISTIFSFGMVLITDKIFVNLFQANPVIDYFFQRHTINFSTSDTVFYVSLAIAFVIGGTLTSYLLELWLVWASKLVLAKLSGEDILRELLFALGILLFSTGFLLQFLATLY